MATWGDLAAFVKSTYKVVREEPGELRILVRFDDDRTQTVIVGHELLDGKDEWVQIVSPFAMAGQVNLHDLLIELGATTVLAGAVIMGDHVVLRHSLPLANLDSNEFIDPVELIAGTADQLEERFAHGDDDY